MANGGIEVEAGQRGEGASDRPASGGCQAELLEDVGGAKLAEREKECTEEMCDGGAGRAAARRLAKARQTERTGPGTSNGLS